LKEGYELYKDNVKIHKKKAAEEKKIDKGNWNKDK